MTPRRQNARTLGRILLSSASNKERIVSPENTVSSTTAMLPSTTIPHNGPFHERPSVPLRK